MNLLKLSWILGCCGAWMVMAGTAFSAEEVKPDHTCFQTGSPYSQELDIGSDIALVYGCDPSFNERVAKWKENGYSIGMMTGIAWGLYADYFGAGETFKKDEVQTRKNGTLFLHGTDIGYNVPTLGYVEFMKKYIDRAVDLGVESIHLEEPEFWAETGWSEAFKRNGRRIMANPGRNRIRVMMRSIGRVN